MLKLVNVYKSYGDLEVLKGISFNLAEHEVFGIIGPSGSGKSTILRCINFLIPPTSGDIFLDGELVGYRLSENGHRKRLKGSEIAKQRRRMSMVFQLPNLWPHRTVLENVIEGPINVCGISKKDAINMGMEVLKKVGLEEKANAYPSRLSGGQQQRVGIARALAMQPKVILFDEPTSSLDPELVGEVLLVMEDLVKQGLTMIVVTHEMNFAKDACDRVIFIDGGVIVDEGPPDYIFGGTQNPRVQTFLMYFLKKK